MGKVATSPLPPRGFPPLKSGGVESELAHKWARWLQNPCCLKDAHRFGVGGKIRSGPQVGKVATSPCRLGDPHRLRAGGKIRSGPQLGKVATSPLPPRGSPPLKSGGAKSEVAHKWARWLHHPCRLGDPHRLKAGGRNQKWPTSGQGGYITPAASGIPTASERGAKSEVPQVGKVATSPLQPRGSAPLKSGGAKSQVAHKWARWLHHPCRLGDPHRFRAGGKIKSGPQVGKVATSPLPPRGSPLLKSGGPNHKWPTSGQGGYITRAASGIPTASQRGAKSEVAHKWARWLHHPCRLGDPHCFKAGGQNQTWPTSGQDVATLPTCGPLLILSRALKRWGSLRQQG